MEISIEVLKKALPDKYKRSLNEEVLEDIAKIFNDENLHEAYRDNLLSYTNVLKDGKFKLKDYLNAVKYVTHKMMGDNNTDSYIKTFPDRYARLVANGTSAKDITSLVTVYNKSKLVNLIMEQTMIPTWVLNQDLYQKALNVQVELMMTATSEKVRSDAANSILNQLKPPEVKKVELDIGLKENKELDNMRTMLAELSAKQKQLIDANVVSTQEIAQTRLIPKVIEHDE